MSPLHEALNEYVTIRRSLGYQFYGQRLLLEDFVAFMEQADAPTVTIELAVRWARMPKDTKPIWWARPARDGPWVRPVSRDNRSADRDPAQ